MRNKDDSLGVGQPHDSTPTLMVIDELAGIVGAYLSGDKGLQKVMGSPITVQKYWLDIDFPYGPPQEYEQSG